MAAKIHLPVVDDPDFKNDSIIRPAAGMKMPLFKGEDADENLACGACKTVIARNVATRTLIDRLGSKSGRLLAVCECGAYNLIRTRRVGDIQG
jgi:hypothetical protein